MVLLKERTKNVDYLIATPSEISPLSFEIISMEVMVRAKQLDHFFIDMLEMINDGESIPFVDDNKTGILVRQLYDKPQVVVPKEQRSWILQMAPYSLAAAHPGGRKIYRTLQVDYYWPSMSLYVYNTVRNCRTCPKERVGARKRNTNLKLFTLPSRA